MEFNVNNGDSLTNSYIRNSWNKFRFS